MSVIDFQLVRNSFGRLVLTTSDGEVNEGVVPVRAFPIEAPNEGVSLVAIDGRELAWIPDLFGISGQIRTLVEQELATREFMPEIQCLHQVSSFATPSIWRVSTSRGDTSFTLKGEEDIRRLRGGILLISDSHGIQFLIRDVYQLDRNSRRLLDRFL